MAPTASAQHRRSGDGALLFLYTALAALGLFIMRIVTSLTGNPVGFMEMFLSHTLPDGTPIKKGYIGIQHLDEGLALLVTAFVFGPLRHNEAFYWQQIHFLIQITPIIAIMNVEACRERNQASWLK